MMVHPNSSTVLGEDHLAVMLDDTHKYFRHLTSSILTPARLAEVIPTQYEIMKQHLEDWIKNTEGGKTMLVRHGVRDMVMDQNQLVFLGGYLSAEYRKKFAVDWGNVNDGLLSFPMLIPGLGLWKARESRFRLTNNIEDCFRRCRNDVNEGREVHPCLMSHWIKHLTETKEILETNEDEMTHSILDFMFASQDASISALTWTVDLMHGYPEVFAKVREEQKRLRPNNEPVTAEHVRNATYTRQVVNEILRFRPPAIFIPHLAHNDVKLPTCTVPKGALIFVDVYAACREGYSNPDTFNPDRFSSEVGEGEKFRQNYLVFGTGLHVCAGRHYAFNQIVVWLSILATNANFSRLNPDPEYKYQYAPTITPADHVVASFTPLTA
jgi:cytochrome P450 family 710 subfamily A protein